MKFIHWTIRWALYTVIFLCVAWGSLVGYSRFLDSKAGLQRLTTWVPDTQIQHLMAYHGTSVLKVTQDAVYIFRGSKWVPVLKRGHG